MRKVLLSISFIFILSQSAYALSFNAHGGGYAPINDYGDNFDIGYYYGISAEHEIFPWTSLKFSYDRYVSNGKKHSAYSGSKLEGDSIEILVRVAPFDFIVEPYISAGGGYYNNKVRFDNNDKSTYDGFGFVGEAGFNVNFFIMSAGIHAKYTYAKFNHGIKTMENLKFGATFTIHIPLS